MRLVAALAVLCALALPGAAGASIKIAGDVKHPALRVNAAGWATVTYWKSGSWHKAKVSPLGKITWGKAAAGADVTKKTTAVSIPFMKQLRVGPTGRYWALQAWQRLKGIRSAVDPGGLLKANHPVPRLYENGLPTK